MDDELLWVAWEGTRQAWLESKRRLSGGGENTAIAYDVAYRQFMAWSSVPPWRVSTGVARQWAVFLEQQELAPATIALKLAALSSFYEFAAGYSVPGPGGEVTLGVKRNPFEAVERPRVSPYGRARYPTLEEARAMLAQINRGCVRGKRDFALLYTFLVTCRRASEVLGMRWGDLQASPGGDYTFRYQYKGGMAARAALNRRCYAAICDYLDAAGRPVQLLAADEYIWVPLGVEQIGRLPQFAGREVEVNHPISTSFANRLLKKYARRAGVAAEVAHLHGLRHAGTRLRVQLMRSSGEGVDYQELRDLLGHRSIAVTQVYSDQVLEEPADPVGDAAAEALLGGPLP